MCQPFHSGKEATSAISQRPARGIMEAPHPESFLSQGHPNSVTEKQQHFFFEHYGLTNQDLENYLQAALSAGGDYADVYFEYLTSTSLMVDESMVKSGSQSLSSYASLGGRRDYRKSRIAHARRSHRSCLRSAH